MREMNHVFEVMLDELIVHFCPVMGSNNSHDLGRDVGLCLHRKLHQSHYRLIKWQHGSFVLFVSCVSNTSGAEVCFHLKDAIVMRSSLHMISMQFEQETREKDSRCRLGVNPVHLYSSYE